MLSIVYICSVPSLASAAVAAVRSGVEARVYQRIASLMLWAESLHHPQSTVALLR